LRFANGAGALATTKLGAQPSLPSRKEVEMFISKNASI
jgi:sugar/nucleoside kinase (ribokinase family)